MSGRNQENAVRVTLPATSANLGPGFDAVGVALSLTLTVEARRGHTDQLEAAGRDADLCGVLEGNLILSTYRSALQAAGVDPTPLELRVENEIPLGMGCGSSAAARLAGIVLANHFGELGWTDEKIVATASEMEGHPDNIAACWYGGFTVSVPHEHGVLTASFPCDGTWQMLLVLPEAGLATEKARGVLPDKYPRADTVFNVQRAALLTAAFAQQRLDLLRVAMQDRIHQPFRREICGLLQHLNQVHEAKELAGVALSGAGPALLAVLSETATLQAAEERIRRVVGREVELLPVRVAGGAQVELL